MSVTPAVDRRVLPIVALGGVAGSLGRYAVGLALPHGAAEFPWATLLVNVTGSFAMGLLVAWLLGRPGAHPLVRPFVGVGVLGGWTTFSAFAIDVVHLIDAGRASIALGYVAASVVVGVVAVGVGLWSGSGLRTESHRRPEREQ